MSISILDKAITLAVACHANHLDKAGYPEILHPLAVMGRLRYESDEIRAAAVLHDTVEDGYTTIDHIGDNFPTKVTELVRLLTRKKGIEQYFDYIRKIATDSDAIMIKKADIADNMSRRSPEELKGIHKKYRKALRILDGKDENAVDGLAKMTLELPAGMHELVVSCDAENNLLYIKFPVSPDAKVNRTLTDVMGRSGLHVDLHKDGTCYGIEII